MSDPLLEETKFDVIIVGTGIQETILSAALTLAGKKVLHLDENDYYGSSCATLSFKQFRRLMENQRVSANDITPQPAPEVSGTLIPLPSDPKLIKNPSFSFYDKEKAQKLSENLENNNEEPVVEKQEGEKQEGIEEELNKLDRRFNIDVANQLLWARGKDIDNFVKSGTFRYLEFLCLSHSYILDKASIEQVPCSKKDIFKSKYISLIEKRSLMKFVTASTQIISKTAASENKQNETGENKSESTPSQEPKELTESGESKEEEAEGAPLDPHSFSSFLEFVRSQNVSKKLENFILYVISLFSTFQDENNQVSAIEGLQRMKKYTESQGVYGDTPFLFPLYGLSEITQAYSRLAAVHGGIFILCRRAVSLVLDEANSVKGVICSAGQYLEATHFITSPKYFPTSTSTPKIARCVCITDKSLVDKETLINLIIPPTAENRQTVFVVQLDSTIQITPAGKFLLHLQCNYYPGAHEYLAQCLDKLLSTSKNSPTPIYRSFFDVLEYTNTEPVPNGVFISSDSVSTDIGYDQIVLDAEKLFRTICGDEAEFFPKIDINENPDGEEI